MKKFLNSYLDPHGKVSSRRFNGLIGLAFLIGFSITRIFVVFPLEVLYIFLGLAVGSSASLIGQKHYTTEENIDDEDYAA